MAHMTKVRLYYSGPKNTKQVAPANTVIFDLPEDVAEDALARGYIREATEGEIAEARVSMPAVKKSPKKATKAEVQTDQTGGGGDDTTPGGGEAIKNDADLA